MPPEAHPKLELAVTALRAGKLVVFPTETFYGIAADIEHPFALEALSRLKERDPSSPIALIAGDTESAFALASETPEIARQLAARFWPGPLTLVLPARPGLHHALIGPTGVGVRVSSHPVARGLAEKLGRPVTATSANLKGRAPVAVAAELDSALLAKIEVVLEDKIVRRGGLASTVVEVSGGHCRIVRAGAIGAEMIATVSAGVGL